MNKIKCVFFIYTKSKNSGYFANWLNGRSIQLVLHEKFPVTSYDLLCNCMNETGNGLKFDMFVMFYK